MSGISKLKTNISGFDLIANGGLPQGRTTLVTGTSGSAKTVFAMQFLAAGIEESGEPGVFVTFEESPESIRQNVLGFGWDVARWEAEGRWAFVDASPEPGEAIMMTGGYDLGALLARVDHAVRKIGAKRVAIDSVGGVFAQFPDQPTIRHELFRLTRSLNDLGVTAVVTAERTEEYGAVARHAVEEFVSDNVVILRNVLDEEVRRRTLEILKFRGTDHLKGEWPFTIVHGEGLVAIPLAALELKQKSSDARITSGNPSVDQMCGGGFFRDSVVLVSGATGTGKTLMSSEFLAGGAAKGEKCLLFAFEESREQLFRNAAGWGIDFAEMERNGLLELVCTYPEATTLEDCLILMKRTVERFKPDRVAVDSLSALERVAPLKGFREFVIGLTSFIKHMEIPALFTATTDSLMGGSSITEAHISTITDSIILLRYVELFGEIRRGITVLKMRGSKHDKIIREFTIDGHGMHIGRAFRDVSGILTGRLVHSSSSVADEHRRLDSLFDEESGKAANPGGSSL
jgi:circadian clock protein KaiC